MSSTSVSSVLFVFGCLTDPFTMRARAPGAKPIGGAFLDDHRLLFVGHSNGWGGGVATVKACVGARVPGVLWEVTPACIEALDRFEGVPYLYTREAMDLGDDRSGWFYQHTGGELRTPSSSYRATIERGLRRFGMGTSHVAVAVAECERFVERRNSAFARATRQGTALGSGKRARHS